MKSTVIKYQDKLQNEVIFVISDSHFSKHFLQKRRQSESSGFRSIHNFSPSNQPTTFTGKEWCKSQWLAQRGPERGISETGYGYFGARYYDSDLSGMFISFDPMADKYPEISPYHYCHYNPIKRIDIAGLFDTEKRAIKAREKAVKKNGEDRVGNVYNNGSQKNPNYSFAIFGKGKDRKTYGIK